MASLCLTTDDCNSLLNNISDGNYELSKFHLEPFSKEVRGLLGEHFLLTLNVKNKREDKKLSFFVKSAKCPGLRELYRDIPIFDKEVFVYKFFKTAKKLIPKLDITPIPKLYYYTSEEMIILENLAALKYIGCKHYRIDKPHMLLVLKALAKFHSITIAYEEYRSEELERKYELTEDYNQFLHSFFDDDIHSTGYRTAKTAFESAEPLINLIVKNELEALETTKKLLKYHKKFVSVLNDANSYRKVVCHGDLWANNALFRYKNGTPIDCKIFDFQLVHYAPPAHDVTMTIFMGSDHETFRRNVHEYYHYYYNSLKYELERLDLDITNILPVDEYNETCRVYMPIGKLIFYCYRQYTQSKKTLEGDILKDVMFDTEVRRKFIVENLKEDENYRKILTQLTTDVKFAVRDEVISIEDCFKMVEEEIGSKDYEFVDFQVIPFVDKGGFLGEHSTVTVTIKREVEEKLFFFLKSLPTTEIQKKFIADANIAVKEMKFYNEIIPDFLKFNIKLIQECVPKSYLAEPQFLVLQNLKTEGYTTEDARVGQSLESMKLSIESLAKLHVSGFIYEEKLKEKYGKPIKLNEVYPMLFKETFYTELEVSLGILHAAKSGFEEIIYTFSNYTSNITPAEFIRIVNNIVDNYANFVKPSSKFRNTICHADLWTNNIMTKRTPEESKSIIVDFQFYRYAAPGHDLIEHIYLSMTKEMLETHLQELLDFYYNTFKSCLADYGYSIDSILPYEEFLDSVEDGKFFAKMQKGSHFQTIMLSPKAAANVFIDPIVAEKCFFSKDRHILVRNNHKSDPVYKQRLKESIVDIRKLCEEIHDKNLKFGIN